MTAAVHDPDDRHRRGRRLRRPGARAARPARPERSLRAEVPQALRGARRATCATAVARVRGRRAQRAVSGRRAQLLAWTQLVERSRDMRAARARRRARAASASASCRRWAFLHEGHLRSSTRRGARASCVVMSIFVNPLQFGPTEDFARYPRDLEGDAREGREPRRRPVFAPDVAEMYRDDRTSRRRRAGDRRRAGRARCGPGTSPACSPSSRSCSTLSQPDVAVFGQKDFQQATLVRRMVRDLDFPIELVVAPTVREPDGLALSSRNTYLDAASAASALALVASAARGVRAASRRGERDGERLAAVGHERCCASGGRGRLLRASSTRTTSSRSRHGDARQRRDRRGARRHDATHRQHDPRRGRVSDDRRPSTVSVPT